MKGIDFHSENRLPRFRINRILILSLRSIFYVLFTFVFDEKKCFMPTHKNHRAKLLHCPSQHGLGRKLRPKKNHNLLGANTNNVKEAILIQKHTEPIK